MHLGSDRSEASKIWFDCSQQLPSKYQWTALSMWLPYLLLYLHCFPQHQMNKPPCLFHCYTGRTILHRVFVLSNMLQLAKVLHFSEDKAVIDLNGRLWWHCKFECGLREGRVKWLGFQLWLNSSQSSSSSLLPPHLLSLSHSLRGHVKWYHLISSTCYTPTHLKKEAKLGLLS